MMLLKSDQFYLLFDQQQNLSIKNTYTNCLMLREENIKQTAWEVLYHLFYAQSKQSFVSSFHWQKYQCTHYCLKCVIKLLNCWAYFFDSDKHHSDDHYKAGYYLKKRMERSISKRLKNIVIQDRNILDDGIKQVLTEMTFILLQEEKDNCEYETILLMLAMIYFQLENFKSSIQYCMKLKKRYPSDELYNYLHAKNLASMSNYKQALEQIKDILKEKEQVRLRYSYELKLRNKSSMSCRLKSNVYNLKGTILSRMQLKGEAEVCYKLALKAYRYNKDTYYSLCCLFSKNLQDTQRFRFFVQQFKRTFNDSISILVLSAIKMPNADLMAFELKSLNLFLTKHPNQEYRIHRFKQLVGDLNFDFLNYEGDPILPSKISFICKYWRHFYKGVKEYRNGNYQESLNNFQKQEQQKNIQFKIMCYIGLDKINEAIELFRSSQIQKKSRGFECQFYTVIGEHSLAIEMLKQDIQFIKDIAYNYLCALMLLILNGLKINNQQLVQQSYNKAQQLMQQKFSIYYDRLYHLVRINYFLAEYSFENKLFAKGKTFVRGFNYFINIISLLNPSAAQQFRKQISKRQKYDIKMLDCLM